MEPISLQLQLEFRFQSNFFSRKEHTEAVIESGPFVFIAE
jgi:hypothetical protein